VAIQFEYCFPIIGLCIDTYEYGMLSMGFDCCLEEIVLYEIYRGIGEHHTTVPCAVFNSAT
jgi:hypothetical protein